MAKPVDLVQVIKWESADGGGNPADDVPFPEGINADEDAVSAAGFSPQASGVRDRSLMIWRDGNDMMFEDLTVGSGVKLQQLLEGSGVAGADEKVKVSIDDTTAGFLEDKLVPGSGIQTTVLNDGGNEQLEISFDGAPLPPPTQIGQLLYSVDGLEFSVELPLTSRHGWLITEDGIHIVVG